MCRNRLESNGIGVFFCWGVRHGLAEGNTCLANRAEGISIGHRDTDNIIRSNEIRDSGGAGVLLRSERGAHDAPHRNVLVGNCMVDNGPGDGAAVEVRGAVSSLALAANEIRETRGPAARVGVRINPACGDVRLFDNMIEGFATAVEGPCDVEG